MQILFSRHLFGTVVVFILLLLGGAVFFTTYIDSQVTKETPQAVVTRGDVRSMVSISGKTEALQSATLRFPVVGTVAEIYKHEGESVQKGDVIASLTQDALVAAYTTARERLAFYESSLRALIEGPSEAARRVTATNVAIAEEHVNRTKAYHRERVTQARRALLSHDLVAKPVNLTNNDTPPVITGSYLCEKEGAYTLSLFGSKAHSGYSYTLDGLENGSGYVYTETAGTLGTCGLSIQFDATESYQSGDWIIRIPNTESDTYITYLDAYKSAVEDEKREVQKAEDALTLARRTAEYDNAPPTASALDQARAQVDEARAALALEEAKISDRIITAPFDGIIAVSDIQLGEVADMGVSATVIRDGAFKLTARIPEIDITHVHVGQHARATFDAVPEKSITTTVTYISPTATDIEGVAYYEANLTFDTNEAWLREGLNADIDIVTDERTDVLTLPAYLLTRAGDTYTVDIIEHGVRKTQTVTIGLRGNDGMVEVENLSEGTVVSASPD